MVMVIVISAILAAVAIPQFLDYRNEAKVAATQSALGALRTSIQLQKTQMILRCDAASGDWPLASEVDANDITGTSCATPTITIPSGEEQFIASGIPDNPFGSDPGVTDCTGGGCAAHCTGCDGAAFGGGWCYNVGTGDIWADSEDSTEAIKECAF